MIFFGRAACRPTNVEGTHRQLSARLTDGLGGNNTDRLADFDNLIAGKVASIAFDADTVFRLAGEYRAEFNGLYTRFFNLRSNFVSDVLVYID